MRAVMLIISLATGEVNATIQYPSVVECQREIPLARTGNIAGTVRIVCERADAWY